MHCADRVARTGSHGFNRSDRGSDRTDRIDRTGSLGSDGSGLSDREAWIGPRRSGRTDRSMGRVGLASDRTSQIGTHGSGRADRRSDQTDRTARIDCTNRIARGNDGIVGDMILEARKL